MKPIKFLLSATAGAALLSMSALSVQAAEFKLTASSSHPPIIPWVKTIKDHVVPESTKRAQALGHTIKWTEAYSGQLYNFQNTLEGIADNLGDLGWVGTLWEPNKLPLQNATFFTPFVNEDVALAAKIQDELHATIPEMKAAFVKNNQVYLGPQTIDDYVVITKEPLTKFSDLKGKKLYAPGASAGWLKGTGAVGVNGGLPIYADGINKGVADGAIVPGSAIFGFKLHEAAPHVTTVGLGGGITGALTMNKKRFDSLPPEMQKLFMELGAEYGKMTAEGTAGNKSKHFSTLLPKAGAKLATMPVDEQKKWAAALPNLAKEWADGIEAKGLPAKKVITMYMEGVRAAGKTPLRNWDKEL